jgi:hypothetical protein
VCHLNGNFSVPSFFLKPSLLSLFSSIPFPRGFDGNNMLLPTNLILGDVTQPKNIV